MARARVLERTVGELASRARGDIDPVDAESPAPDVPDTDDRPAVWRPLDVAVRHAVIGDERAVMRPVTVDDPDGEALGPGVVAQERDLAAIGRPAR